ncbi:hypothetical protein [Microbacterium maritypicum]|uniref:Uncharacterized protein n=1 Tax=Microbacterium maritypicum TaxID=33918 RepID=A0AAJ5VBH4_MICMQ|nr:hypothetical protein [Microbacterium liquefaciens]MBP5802310.1 hypothetical protein [Microbacterium liquefaciens]WEF21180.1 hypothetical protein PWF71_00510 [Microbacterium liquefaciens]
MVSLEPISAETIQPNLIVGVFTIALGVLIIRYRRPLNEAVFKTQRSMFGERIAQASAGRQKPFMMGVVGAWTVLVGLLMLTAATIGVVQQFT